jgi:hypothetical protein
VNGLSIDKPPIETTEAAPFPVESPKPRGIAIDQDRWFAQWWDEYWLHKAKKAAREAFRKHVRTAARFEQIMGATRAQKAEMLTREPGKRPHGATWLNGERWEDEAAGPSPAAPDDYPEFA